MAKRDYYDVLGVARGASEADLKADFLKDADKRAAYDRFGHAAFEQGAGAGAGAGFGADFASTFADIFDDLFGMGGGRRGRSSGRERGADLRYNMEITLADA